MPYAVVIRCFLVGRKASAGSGDATSAFVAALQDEHEAVGSERLALYLHADTSAGAGQRVDVEPTFYSLGMPLGKE